MFWYLCFMSWFHDIFYLSTSSAFYVSVSYSVLYVFPQLSPFPSSFLSLFLTSFPPLSLPLSHCFMHQGMLLTSSLKQHDTFHITFDSLIINTQTVIPNEASSVDAIKAEREKNKHINSTSYRIESESRSMLNYSKLKTLVALERQLNS